MSIVRLSRLAAWLFAALTVGPLVLMSCYNHPSAADDYCFAYMTRDHGAWYSTKFYFDYWTGRYFASYLFHLTPLLPLVGFAKVLPLLTLALLGGVLYDLLAAAFPFFSAKRLFTTTLVGLGLLVIGTPGIAEAFFWSSGNYVYTLPTILYLHLLVMLHRLQSRREARWLHTLRLVYVAYLVFALVGLSEMFLLLTALTLGGLWAWQLYRHRRPGLPLTLLLIWAAGWSLLVIKSPGNAGRIGDNPLGGNIPYSLYQASFKAVVTGLRWAASPLVLGLTLLWISFFSERKPLPKLPFVALPAGLLGLLVLLYFPNYYGIGIEPPTRVYNVAWHFFVLGWFGVWAVAAMRFEGLRLMVSRRKAPYLAALLGVGAGLFVSPNLFMLIRDLRLGTARAYDAQLSQRYRQIAQSRADTVQVLPLTARPASLLVEDIQQNPAFLWNKCEATYFRKKALVLQPNP